MHIILSEEKLLRFIKVDLPKERVDSDDLLLKIIVFEKVE